MPRADHIDGREFYLIKPGFHVRLKYDVNTRKGFNERYQETLSTKKQVVSNIISPSTIVKLCQLVQSSGFVPSSPSQLVHPWLRILSF